MKFGWAIQQSRSCNSLWVSINGKNQDWSKERALVITKRELSVFIGLREVAGFCGNLQRGVQALGVKCTFLDLGGTVFKHSAGHNPKWVRTMASLATRFGAAFSGNFVLRFIWLTTFQNIFSAVALCIALLRYDVFIMVSNSTFLYFLEVPLLRLLGKRVIYVFLGSDSRPLYLNGAAFTGRGSLTLVRIMTRVQRAVVRFIERSAHACVNHPPQAYFHQRPFVSVLHVGLPYAGPCKEPSESADTGRPIRIIHIPSKAGPKGSDRFRAIIERLKQKYSIDYVEMTGIPHRQVLETIAGADMALDEFFSDTPMAVFATECAFHGVPVVVGGYYSEYVAADHPGLPLPPSMFVVPDEVEQAIEHLIVDREKRAALGKAAFAYVTTRWTAEQVAAKYMRIIEGDIPKEWMYDPYQLRYTHGAGLHEDELKENIRLFMENGSTSSLALDDKPYLVRALVGLSRQRPLV